MGSTVVAVRIEDRHAEIAWVGDSRAYLWRSDTLRQLSRDHSYLEVLREQENLSETQLRGHPNKNLVTQTLGIGTPEPSSITEPLRRGDWLLLCSDGLNDELEDAEIAQILRAHNGAGCCRRCVDRRGAGARWTRQRERRAGGVRRAEWRKLRAENDTVARGSRRRLHGDPPGGSLVVVLRTLTISSLHMADNQPKLIKVSNQREIAIKPEMVLGRVAECDLQLTEGHASRRHAKLFLAEDGVWVEDLNSANGTFVNGAKITGKVKLSSGDRLRFDVEEFDLHIAGAAPAPSTTARRSSATPLRPSSMRRAAVSISGPARGRTRTRWAATAPTRRSSSIRRTSSR